MQGYAHQRYVFLILYSMGEMQLLQAQPTAILLQTTTAQRTAAHQLNRNGQTLSLLHAEPADAWHTHNRVAQTAQLHQVHDLIHKGINGTALNLKEAYCV